MVLNSAFCLAFLPLVSQGSIFHLGFLQFLSSNQGYTRRYYQWFDITFILLCLSSRGDCNCFYWVHFAYFPVQLACSLWHCIFLGHQVLQLSQPFRLLFCRSLKGFGLLECFQNNEIMNWIFHTTLHIVLLYSMEYLPGVLLQVIYRWFCQLVHTPFLISHLIHGH